MVLCVDEKSQIQALDRSQPLLPMRPGQVERRTHDYTRHGTTSALNTATGSVIGKCYKRHRSFLDFLREIERQVPAELDIHIAWTTTPPTKRRRSVTGSPSARIGICISRRQVRPGSIRLNASSLSLLRSKSGAAYIARPKNSRRQSPRFSTTTTKSLSLSSGSRPLTRFSTVLSASVPEHWKPHTNRPKSLKLQNRDTRAYRVKTESETAPRVRAFRSTCASP